MANVKLFIDFWNFQLAWNRNVRPEPDASLRYVPISWKTLPHVLIGELPSVLGPSDSMTFKGANVYASVDGAPNSNDQRLKGFLSNTLGQMTGYTVSVRDRRHKSESCPHCKSKIDQKVEKGVDTAIITDLFGGAINNSYDIAALLSNDSDFVPAVEMIQDRLNRQVIHAGFNHGGDHLRTAAWGHVSLDGDIASRLRG